MESTAVRLRRLMDSRNLRQADILRLAQPYCEQHKIKLNKSDLSQFLSGKVTPGQWKLTILGLALNVSEAWLMGLDVPIERKAEAKLSPNANLTPAKEKVLSLLEGLPEEEIMEFYEAAKALLYLRNRNGNTKED